MSFAARLKTARMRKGYSLQKLADLIGASKAHIWDLETARAKNPSLEVLTGLSRALDVSITQLIGESASDDEPETARAMFRDLQTLSETDQETIKLMMDRLRERKKEG